MGRIRTARGAAVIAFVALACAAPAACSSTTVRTPAAPSSTSSGPATVVVHRVSTGAVHAPVRVVAPTGAAVSVPAGAPSPSGRQAQSFTGVATVGPLFLVIDHVATIHPCTAVVVHSTGGDLIMTAAHCVYGGLLSGYHADLAFVPGYHDGQAPYGAWAATNVIVDSRWISSQNPDLDVAFLTLARADATGGGTLEHLTGADTIGFNPSFTGMVDVIAYTLTGDEPISCASRTSEFSATQLQFDCGGYSEGSSGSPFVAAMNPATGVGRVIGVIGGHDTGGDSSHSFGVYPGADIAALYRAATGPRSG